MKTQFVTDGGNVFDNEAEAIFQEKLENFYDEVITELEKDDGGCELGFSERATVKSVLELIAFQGFGFKFRSLVNGIPDAVNVDNVGFNLI